ncbi:MAG TPA: hypothetical protein VK563_13700 [Puia sp.]|nr:hypothetical protein [Puia sp.]
MQKYLLALLLPLFSIPTTASAQNTSRQTPTTPIISTERDSTTFYDRLDKTLKGARISYTNSDSSFNWLVGSWTVAAKGFAKTGYRGKKEFSWNEPTVEYLSDEDHTIFMASKDSTTFTTGSGKQKGLLPPQVILQYDNYGKVWALQPGYHDRYDWGSLISDGWQGNKIVFKGTIALAGLKVNESQTWTKISDHEFRIVYEENLSDNSWFLTEENVFTKVK